ncbi:cell wall-binding repeat-containing protein [Salinibacterium soli]|uniref:cellulase n=1 Tax=Antiquaquibacter soli TaxID=3064523 RepID=A0ABT9BTH2_9MICO|nr:cell wall-binding repeat-containing protein [Protaetiibacter sp. WY-16]MDO7883687.1 cell wall-binding repeat-containing protein [Protaetiibacter sp. WY-16]
MGIRTWITAVTAAVVIAMPLAPPPPATAAPPAAQPVVVGNRLVDARTGLTFVPRGANWPSFEYACWQGWGYSGDEATAAEAALMASWRINTVRIPLNQDCWLGLRGSPAGSGRTAEGYRAAVEAWVAKLNAAGIVAILDLHTSAPPGYSAHGQRAMPDSQSTAFWSSVAARFSSNRSVMFDLFNEPYSRWGTSSWVFELTWQCWRDGGCRPPVEDDYTGTLSGATYAATGMSALVAAVRTAGAEQPILLGGIDYANDLRQWLAFRPDDDQLVASWHNYPAQRCRTTTCWNTEIAPVAAVVPVVSTEFGQTDGGSGHLTTFMTWAEAHGVGYLPWAWWRVEPSESLSNSRYALVTADDQPKSPAGTALYAQLASIPPDPEPPVAVERISGVDRFAVGVEVSRRAYPGPAPVVVIANGLGFADALSAGPAAATLGGPLLLVTPTGVPGVVRDEIERLDPDRIIVVGGPASVSDSVVAQLKNIQPDTIRLWGPDRYAASRAVVEYAFPSSDGIYVATGATFPDALSAAAAGGARGWPVLLVPGSAPTLDSATSALLGSVAPDRIVVAGGPASVSTGIQSSLSTIAPTTRLWGADRFEASLAIALDGFPRTDRVLLATGANFPDALSASAWAGRLPAPLVAVPGSCVPRGVLDYLESADVQSVILVGGPASLSPAVEALSPC